MSHTCQDCKQPMVDLGESKFEPTSEILHKYRCEKCGMELVDFIEKPFAAHEVRAMH